MKYAKPPLTFDDQADRLINRGMAGDRATMIHRLASVNYYRLSGYWFPYRNPDSTFKPGTSFDQIWNRYVFDRRLRLLVMDALERIEIAVRAQLAYHHAHRHGPFAYATDPSSMPKQNAQRHTEFVDRLREETARSRERFVDHFESRYGDNHVCLPVWMATEIMSFGSVLSFFRGASHQVKQNVASFFAMPHVVLDSWLMALNAVRNICAHHGRLWNRELGVKPLIPLLPKYPDWNTPVPIAQNRVFAVLTICRYCMRYTAPQSHWPERLVNLLDEFPGVPKANIGFPENWRECPIWRNTP